MTIDAAVKIIIYRKQYKDPFYKEKVHKFAEKQKNQEMTQKCLFDPFGAPYGGTPQNPPQTPLGAPRALLSKPD